MTKHPTSEEGELEPPEGHATDEQAWADMVERYGDQQRGDLCGGNLTDLEAAFHIAMLDRRQLDHEGVLSIARDRIRWLSIQLAKATALNRLRDELARPSPALLSGGGEWVLVPREPTPEMVAAAALSPPYQTDADRDVAARALCCLPETRHPAANDVLADIARDYRAMIAAAPTPPEGTEP